MKRKLMILGAAITLVFASCTNDSNSNEQKRQEQTVETTESDTNEETIRLNDGKKWKVNDEMLPHIQKSEEAFKNFKSDEYNELSGVMMEHTNKLIQSCTMEGASHDELHKWLHPHIELIREMGQKSNGEEVYEDLAVSFENFHTYFE